MHTFESVLLILAAAMLLKWAADRAGLPSPVVLAFGGAAAALVPGMPELTVEPELVLAVLVAPILLDAAYDTSLRDLKRTWLTVASLVFMAVAFTTGVVAIIARQMVPDMPWAAALALGAIVAPPDAASAIAVLRQVRIPHSLLVILEGESLLNDASALLIYRIAVSFAVGASLDTPDLARTIGLGVLGSAIGGWITARSFIYFTSRVTDPPTSVILQFLSTFGVWLLAERLGLSPIVTVVAHGITVARVAPRTVPAALRIPSYAVWESVVLVLNILAFVLIGLQIKPILQGLSEHELRTYAMVAAAVLAATILSRAMWVMFYNVLARAFALLRRMNGHRDAAAPTFKDAIVVSWCGMRGIVTLAAALALPAAMPHRGLILVCAFVVVLGTLAIQGLTLGPLVRRLRLRLDTVVEDEVAFAWRRLTAISQEVQSQQWQARRQGEVPPAPIHLNILIRQRERLLNMRESGEIGDTAFHAVEEELDWMEVATRRKVARLGASVPAG